MVARGRPTSERGVSNLTPPAARWDGHLGEYVLEWDDVIADPDPHRMALEFARSVVSHTCRVCEWDPLLASSVHGVPPPLR